jgi:hypothetical protein
LNEALVLTLILFLTILEVLFPLRTLKLSETYQNGEEPEQLEAEKKFLTEFR